MRNATGTISELLDAGDDEAAVAMIASCAEMLGSSSSVGSAGATEARSDLLALAWNSTIETSTASVDLQAATLSLILAVPAEIDDATAASAIGYAGRVANLSRALGSISDDTRSSLVQALSLTIDAGSLSSAQPIRHQSAVVDSTASAAIEGVVQHIHFLSLGSIAPGEEPLVTQAASLSISSSESSCVMGSCPETVVSAPVLAGHASSDASFTIGPATLDEMMSSDDGDGEVGLLAIRWKVNPYQSSPSGTTTEGGVEFPRVASNTSVTSLSVTSNGRETSVANLSSPLLIELPVFSGDGAQAQTDTPEEDSFELVCSPADGGVTTIVHCNSTSASVNVTCPHDSLDDVRVNVSCPALQHVPACQYFSLELDAWSTAGCDVVSVEADGSSVVCACDHLTSFVGTVGASYTSTRTTFTALEDFTPSDISKVIVVLALLFAMYCYAIFYTVRDLVAMQRAHARLAEQIWQSDRFQSSITWLQRCVRRYLCIFCNAVPSFSSIVFSVCVTVDVLLPPRADRSTLAAFWLPVKMKLDLRRCATRRLVWKRDAPSLARTCSARHRERSRRTCSPSLS